MTDAAAEFEQHGVRRRFAPGLALARELAELQGGTARAESGGPGAGAELVIALPRAPARWTTTPTRP